MIYSDHDELSDEEFERLRDSCLKGTFRFKIKERTRVKGVLTLAARNAAYCPYSKFRYVYTLFW